MKTMENVKIDSADVSGKTVIVTGDRGWGLHKVQLASLYEGEDVAGDDEVVWEARIVENVGAESHTYQVGEVVYVVKDMYGVDGTWGGIDPFINNFNEN